MVLLNAPLLDTATWASGNAAPLTDAAPGGILRMPSIVTLGDALKGLVIAARPDTAL